MNYKVIDKETYYRKGVFRHFSEDCKCSTSMTARVDVTDLVEYSGKMGTKFYINFLYILSRVLNSREDYRMGYLWQTDELICYDVINPTQYVFHEDTETCTPVYTEYVTMHEKNQDGKWQQIIATPGFIGKDGLGAANINDAYTPVGTFTIDKAFGLADDPGCQMEYTKVD